MKRTYSAPTVEKVEFRYNEQIVASWRCQTYQGISNPSSQTGVAGCCEWGPINTNQ